MTRALAITALLLIGCGGSKDAPAGDPSASDETTKPATAADASAAKPTMGQVPCAKVASHLTGLSKGDISRAGITAAQRPAAAKTIAALETNVAATCKRLWNDDTRRCLLAAKTDVHIKQCKKYQRVDKAPAPKLPAPAGAALPTCDAVINHLLVLASREVAASHAIPAPAKSIAMAKVNRLAGLLVPMCMRGWPGRLKTCVIAAKTVTELEPCRKYMPASLKKLEQEIAQ